MVDPLSAVHGIPDSINVYKLYQFSLYTLYISCTRGQGGGGCKSLHRFLHIFVVHEIATIFTNFILSFFGLQIMLLSHSTNYIYIYIFEFFTGMITSAYAAAFQLCPDTQYLV